MCQGVHWQSSRQCVTDIEIGVYITSDMSHIMSLVYFSNAITKWISRSIMPFINHTQKSKYVGHLQSVAKVREIESDRRYERKLLKERKEEDEEFGDKQKFVTSAYRKKLLEEQKWEYEDRLADKVRGVCVPWVRVSVSVCGVVCCDVIY